MPENLDSNKTNASYGVNEDQDLYELDVPTMNYGLINDLNKSRGPINETWYY